GGGAAFLDEAAEVFDQLLAALSRVDATAVKEDRAMQPVLPAEDRASAQDMRRVVAGCALLVGGLRPWRIVRAGSAADSLSRSRCRVLVGHRRDPRIRLLLRQVDPNPDDLLEERTVAEPPLDEAPLALGQVTDGRWPREDFLKDAE